MRSLVISYAVEHKRVDDQEDNDEARNVFIAYAIANGLHRCNNIIAK